MRRKKTSPVKPIKAQLNALEKLKRLDLSLHVIWSRRGIPSHLCGILSVEIEKDPEEAARKFLLNNLKLFKMKEGLQDLTLIRKVNSLGAAMLYSSSLSMNCLYTMLLLRFIWIKITW